MSKINITDSNPPPSNPQITSTGEGKATNGHQQSSLQIPGYQDDAQHPLSRVRWPFTRAEFRVRAEFRGRGSDESELLETCDLVSCALPTADCVDVALDGRQPPSSSELEPAVPRWRG